MNKIEIKAGDTFVYRSIYGGTVVDKIESVNVVHVLQEDGIMVADYGIKSSQGIPYKLSEIQVVSKVFTPEETAAIREKLDKIKALKGVPMSEKMAILANINKFKDAENGTADRQHS